VVGRERIQFLQSLTPADLNSLENNQAALSIYTNENGGIIDDLVMTKKHDSIYVVSNAGCREKDLNHLKIEAKKWDVDLKIMDAGLIALQGI
jgi:aminomethyltransferase